MKFGNQVRTKPMGYRFSGMHKLEGLCASICVCSALAMSSKSASSMIGTRNTFSVIQRRLHGTQDINSVSPNKRPEKACFSESNSAGLQDEVVVVIFTRPC